MDGFEQKEEDYYKPVRVGNFGAETMLSMAVMETGII